MIQNPEKLQKEIGYLLIFLSIFGGVLGYFVLLQDYIGKYDMLASNMESSQIFPFSEKSIEGYIRENSVPESWIWPDAIKSQWMGWFGIMLQLRSQFFLGVMMVVGFSGILLAIGVMMVVQGLESEKLLHNQGRKVFGKNLTQEHLTFWKSLVPIFILCFLASFAYFKSVPNDSFNEEIWQGDIIPFRLEFGFPIPYLEFNQVFWFMEFPAIFVNMICAFLLSVIITGFFWKFIKKRSLREVVAKINVTDISNKPVSRRWILAITSIATALIFLIIGCNLASEIDSLHLNDPYTDSISAPWLVWGKVHSVIFSLVVGLITAGMVLGILRFFRSGKDGDTTMNKALAIIIILPLLGFGFTTYLYDQDIDFDYKRANMPGIKTDYTYGELNSINEYKSDDRYGTEYSIRYPDAEEDPISLSMDEYSIVYDPWYSYENNRKIKVIDQNGGDFIDFTLRSQYPNMRSVSYTSFSEEERYFAFLVDFESDEGQRLLLIFNRAGVLVYEEVFYG